MNFLKWFPLLIVSGFFALNAQNALPQRTVSFDFSVYPIGKADWSSIHYQEQPGEFKPVTFWPYERSPKHAYEGTLPLKFYTPEMGDDGATLWKPVAEVDLDPRLDPHLLFFIPVSGNADQKSEMRIVPFQDDIRTFPLDTITFFNATGANLEGVFGKKSIFLKQGISSPYRLRDYYEQETLIGLAVQYEGEFKKVLQSKWIFREDYREIILLLPPKRAGSMKIQAIRIPQHKEEVFAPPVIPGE